MAKRTEIKKVYVVSQTHWGREWYKTFQGFRTRLVYLIDESIEHIKISAKPRQMISILFSFKS